jgi:UDP-glucose 4-epimerase
MDFVYIDDVARACILAAEAPITDQVFNVASGEETSLSELAAALVAVMDGGVGVEFVEERKVNPVSRRLADTGLAQELLGFIAEVPLEEGLRRLVAWWRAERAVAVAR